MLDEAVLYARTQRSNLILVLNSPSERRRQYMYIIAIGVGMRITCISIFRNLAMEIVRAIVYHMVRATGLPCFAPEFALLIHSERMTLQTILIVSSSNVIFWNSFLSEMNRNEGLNVSRVCACVHAINPLAELTFLAHSDGL